MRRRVDSKSSGKGGLEVSEAKEIEITFPTGRDVLNAYWGFLSNGGLVLPSDLGLPEGEAVILSVTIASQTERYRLTGQVVRRPVFPTTGERTVVAFDPGEPHDMLLSAAWAETDNTPVRRHRRFPVEASVRFRMGEGEAAGRLLNLSFGGCCVRAPASAGPEADIGEPIVICGEDVAIHGVVRWRRAAELGVEFDNPDGLEDKVKRLVRSLR
jgi:hypothetical protein